MAGVPYKFATQSGNVPASELDANFAYVLAQSGTSNFATFNIVSTNVTLTNANVGSAYWATSNITILLPVAATCQNGQYVAVTSNSASPAGVDAQGSDTISTQFATALTSVPITKGVTFYFIAEPSTNTWYVFIGQANAAGSWPVGSVMLTTGNTNPSTLMGFGTWTQIAQGRVIVGVGTGTDKNSVTQAFPAGADSFGEYVHTLTNAEIPTNNVTTGTGAYGGVPAGATFPQSAFFNAGGSDGSHNNIQPTFGVYVWERTA